MIRMNVRINRWVMRMPFAVANSTQLSKSVLRIDDSGKSLSSASEQIGRTPGVAMVPMLAVSGILMAPLPWHAGPGCIAGGIGIRRDSGAD